MTARPWTAAEVRRAVVGRQAGLTLAAIAEAHGRTVRAVQKVLWKQRIVVTPPPQPAPLAAAYEHQQAREALAWELARARSERATAPLLRSWPSGIWS